MTVLLQPSDWQESSGFAHGVVARGRLVFTAGQIGWDELRRIHSLRLVDQVRQALRNVLAIVAEAGGGPQHIVRLTWFITDKAEYQAHRKEIGEAYREIMGYHYPAMSVLVVAALMEDDAKVEIEATAVVPDEE
jgi:enamine deaminase RidA (YjgF/YER057c/UK114 family)